MSEVPLYRIVDLEPTGARAFVTMRDAGTFGLSGEEPVREVMARWDTLQHMLAPQALRVASARQVHGSRVVTHTADWTGWMRIDSADGHVAAARGTAVVVTVADCVPVFLAHPSGVVAVLHAGWRGTAAGVLEAGLTEFTRRGLNARDTVLHCGPAICGSCYEVGPEVFTAVTGRHASGPVQLDLRHELAVRAERAGVRSISTSALCTRCGERHFFSHRAGDSGRQLAVIVAPR
jgi:hypothetical protein